MRNRPATGAEPQSLYFNYEKLIKIYKRGAFIEACNDIFFNEIIEYVFTTEEPARFGKKRIQIRIKEQNTLPINLDDNKY